MYIECGCGGVMEVDNERMVRDKTFGLRLITYEYVCDDCKHRILIRIQD